MGHSEIVMRLSTWQIIQFNILSYVLSAAEEAAGVGQCREVCFACRLASLVLGAGWAQWSAVAVGGVERRTLPTISATTATTIATKRA